MPSRKAVHFGCGNIGRGFVAEFLHKSDYEVVFVDVNDELINLINSHPSYVVTEVGLERTLTFEITHYRAINSKTHMSEVIKEIATADLVTCAVGPNVLKFIAEPIANGIDARTESKPVAVIACENMIGATDTLAGFVKPKLKTPAAELDAKARFANSAIDRIVPAQPTEGALDVTIEKFYEWCVETKAFEGVEGGHPPIDGVHFVADLEPYIERKLYTVNTSHATAAYYGYHKGFKTIHEAMAEPTIKAVVREAIQETSHLIMNKHGITKADQDRYVERIIRRISNARLADMVERVGRAPLRKLGRHDRFVGPAFQLAELGDPVDALLGGMEMALRFQNVEDDEESAELAKLLKSLSAADATKKICGLDPKDKLFERVERVISKVQQTTPNL